MLLLHERARHACKICRTRKKACDKRLPACEYCSHRQITCSYEWASAAGNFDYGRELFTPARPNPINDDLDQLVFAYVCDVHKIIGLPLLSALERYLSGPHKWLPILHPDLVLSEVAAISSSTPPADFSILLLAICLLAVPSGRSSYLVRTHIRSSQFYPTLKRLFLHVQLSLCASKALVQAGLLMSAYEFASGRLAMASISISGCARMAYTCNIDIGANVVRNTGMTASIPEQVNIWWGLVVLERSLSSPSTLMYVS